MENIYCQVARKQKLRTGDRYANTDIKEEISA